MVVFSLSMDWKKSVKAFVVSAFGVSFEEESSGTVAAEVDDACADGATDGPSVLKASIRSSSVRLVLDPVLLEIWIVQVFLQGSDEGDRGLGEKVSARLDVSEVGDITCFKLGMGTLSRF